MLLEGDSLAKVLEDGTCKCQLNSMDLISGQTGILIPLDFGNATNIRDLRPGVDDES
jgi:hypothetical protein